MAEQHLMQVPIRRLPHRYEVVIDPAMERRGHCRKPVQMPSGDEIPGLIRLRTWDEEVFLHECIHALVDDLHLTDLIEEEVARQVSQGLYSMGWRYAEGPQFGRQFQEPTG